MTLNLKQQQTLTLFRNENYNSRQFDISNNRQEKTPQIIRKEMEKEDYKKQNKVNFLLGC